MNIVIYVTARSGTTADPFPAIVTSVRKPVARRGGQNRSVEKGVVQKPEGSVESYQVSRQSRVSRARRSNCAATYCATACAEENLPVLCRPTLGRAPPSERFGKCQASTNVTVADSSGAGLSLRPSVPDSFSVNGTVASALASSATSPSSDKIGRASCRG